jgi:arsenate reductase (thioredoxin)
MKILILCTGNSCRSQMAEVILQSLDSNISVHSAGTHPAAQVHPMALNTLAELGLKPTNLRPKSVEEFLSETWDFVITVCGGAQETCPTFLGKVKNRIHLGVDDPAEATGSTEEIESVFRKVRNEILVDFYRFYHTEISHIQVNRK